MLTFKSHSSGYIDTYTYMYISIIYISECIYQIYISTYKYVSEYINMYIGEYPDIYVYIIYIQWDCLLYVERDEANV